MSVLVTTTGTASGDTPRAARRTTEAYQPGFPLVFLMGTPTAYGTPVELAQAANDGNPYAQAALNRYLAGAR